MIAMTLYKNKNQIQNELGQMLPSQIEECKECDELPPTLHELIMHNFQAKFVCYDKKTNTIEVGVEQQESENAYPQITVHKFRLEDTLKQLKMTFRTHDQDLKFYGKLLAGTVSDRQVDDVVLV